jgi:hypothetical protein
MSRRVRKIVTVGERADLHSKVLQGAAADHLAEFARDVLLSDQERAIRKKIFAIIDSDGPLDPDLAVQSWVELRAVYKLIHRLEKVATGGEAANKTLHDLNTEEQ